MKVTCPSCATNYNIDDKRIPPGGAKIKCAKCQNTFPVKLAAADVGAIPLPSPAMPKSSAIPLPGITAPSHAPQREDWESESTRVAPMPVGGAVPLPGVNPFDAAPPQPADPYGESNDWESESTRVAPMPLPPAAQAVPLPGAGFAPPSQANPFDSPADPYGGQ
ncbi:MAG: zinc-ribbon domain-containing protein, partial [Myxococcaceae bacterium]